MSCAMRGFVDIHAHWLPGVDDGADSQSEALEMLSGLRELGFDTACATPHMRTGMFDTNRDQLLASYGAMAAVVQDTPDMPAIALGCEHHLDDTVFARLKSGEGIPYPAGRSALIELPNDHFPVRLGDRLFELRIKQLRPALAHPERYRPVQRDMEVLDPLLDGGTVLVLDIGALSGQYGRATRRAAEKLAEAGYYYAACSDLHHPDSLKFIERGIRRLFDLMGAEEAQFLLADGPRRILEGQVED